MTLAVRIPLDDDGFILVEVFDGDDRARGGLVPASRAGDAAAKAGVTVIEDAANSLHKSLTVVSRFAKELRRALHDASPDSVEVEFGFDLGVEGGTPLIVHGDASCHVKVTMSWDSEQN